MQDQPPLEYAGFWIRLVATLIDSLLIVMVIAPILSLIYGKDWWASSEGIESDIWYILLNYVFPVIVIITFWVYKSATPGKMAMGIRIVNAKTGEKPSTGQLIGRYFAYYLSTLALMLGFIWVGIDKQKQGWHDKLAGTLVVYLNKDDQVKPADQ